MKLVESQSSNHKDNNQVNNINNNKRKNNNSNLQVTARLRNIQTWNRYEKLSYACCKRGFFPFNIKSDANLFHTAECPLESEVATVFTKRHLINALTQTG